MEIRQLKYFVKVAESGSFSRASEALHVAQPALSTQIASLEQELGCLLLSRSSRGVTQTEAGHTFYQRAKQVLRQLDAMSSIAQDVSQGPSGQVVIGMPNSVATVVSAPLISRVQAAYPRIVLQIEENPSDYLGELLVNGRLDVAVLFDLNLSRGIKAESLLREELCVVGLNAPSGVVEFRDLSGQRVVVPPKTNSLRRLLDDACAGAGIELQIVAEVSSPATMMHLARQGIAAAVLPWSIAASQGFFAPSMTAARLVDPTVTRGISVAVAAQASQQDAMRVVKDTLVRIVRDLVVSGAWPGTQMST